MANPELSEFVFTTMALAFLPGMLKLLFDYFYQSCQQFISLADYLLLVLMAAMIALDLKNASTYRFSSADVEKIIASKAKFNDRPKVCVSSTVN